MSLPINASALDCMVIGKPKADLDGQGNQKVDKTGQLKWSTEIAISRDSQKSDILTVKTAGAEPAVKRGQSVTVENLELIQWEVNGNHGTSFSASTILPVTANSKAS